MSTVLQNFTHIGQLHPLIVHFPITFLFIAPLFLVLGLLIRKWIKPLMVTSLILMTLGTATAYMAVQSGEEASEHMDSIPEINEILAQHYYAAEDTLKLSLTLTGMLAIYVLFILFRNKQFHKTVGATVTILYLILYGICLVNLLNAAHYGGVLVHKHGVHSTLYAADQSDLPE